MRIMTVITCALAMLMSFVSCSMEHAGGISDHGNEKVAGTILNTDGTPAAGATVTLLPTSYNHITDSSKTVALHATTDENGAYSFDKIDEGSYSVEASDSRTGLSGMEQEVFAGEDSALSTDITLQATGSIYFALEDSLLNAGMMIFLPGLKMYGTIDSTRKMNMFDVPVGKVTLRAYDPAKKRIINLGRKFANIELIPGVTLVLPSTSPQPYCLKDDLVIDCVEGYVGDVFTFSPVHPSKRISGNIIYRFSWGDGSISGWSSNIRWQQSWNRPGSYYIQSQMMWLGQYLAWSEPIYIEIKERK